MSKYPELSFNSDYSTESYNFFNDFNNYPEEFGLINNDIKISFLNTQEKN